MSVPKIRYDAEDWPYSLGFIEEAECFIDWSYQREPVDKIVRDICFNFNPIMFQPIMVSLRTNGRYAVIDGQQRLTGIRKRQLEGLGVYKMIPANIYTGLTRAKEAEMYVFVNLQRRGVSPFERFKARLVYRDPTAIEIKRIVEERGDKIGSHNSTNEIGAVRALEEIYLRTGSLGGRNPVRTGPEALEIALATKVDVYPDRADANQGDFLRGIGAFFLRFGDEVDLDRLYDRLALTTPKTLDIDASQELQGTRGQSLRGLGITYQIGLQYNQGLPRKQQLDLTRVRPKRR